MLKMKAKGTVVDVEDDMEEAMGGVDVACFLCFLSPILAEKCTPFYVHFGVL